MTVWGNHSTTQYPDLHNAKVGDESAWDAVGDEGWVADEFIPRVGKRGEDKLPTKVGSKLYSNDVLRTGDNGKLKVLLNDAKLFGISFSAPARASSDESKVANRASTCSLSVTSTRTNVATSSPPTWPTTT